MTLPEPKLIACACPEGPHWDTFDDSLTTHRFQLWQQGSLIEGTAKWRWTCSCEARGHWQYQSDSASLHGWLRHTRRYVDRQLRPEEVK